MSLLLLGDYLGSLSYKLSKLGLLTEVLRLSIAVQFIYIGWTVLSSQMLLGVTLRSGW